VSTQQLAAQTRRALVIGIDKYEQPATTLAAWRTAVAPAVAEWRTRVGEVKLASGESAAKDARKTVPSLDGSVNDAKAFAAMISAPKYGFTDVRMLLDKQATRAGIIAALEKLVNDTKPNDIVVVYYAGHGSQRVNSLNESLTHLDQTLVPVDANAGQFDIRDSELAGYFDRIIDARGVLSLIFDSCHSGSITRGQAVPGKMRWAAADPRDAKDSKRPDPPEDRQNGALVLAAAEEFQFAQETFDPQDQLSHGAFTSALLHVMRDMPANTPAIQVFARTRAILQQDDRQQNPVLRGVDGVKKSRPLFGLGTAATDGNVLLAVQRVEEDTVLLQGGTELGFGVGTELRRADTTRGRPVRLRIAAKPSMGSSKAVVVSGKVTALASGDLLAVDKWIAPDRPALRVWMPAAMPQATVRQVGAAIEPLAQSAKLDLVTDATTVPNDGRPLYVVRHDAAGWRLTLPSGEEKPLASATAAAIESVVLTEHAAAERREAADSAALHRPAPPSEKPRVMVILPPSSGLRTGLALGRGTRNDAIEITSDVRAADYILIGRDADGTIEYAWTRPNVRAGTPSSLPARTDWFRLSEDNEEATAHRVENSAIGLARVNGWLTLESPRGAAQFPYHLALRNIATGEVKDSGTTRGGEEYDLVLKRDSTIDPRSIQPRWVYIFAIDSYGKGTPIWGADNTIPFDSAQHKVAPVTLSLKPNAGAFLGVNKIQIGPPYGTDTFIMLTSATQLDPSVMDFDAVRTRGGARGVDPSNPLESLLSTVGGATRGTPTPVPVTWSIQRIPLRSVDPSGKNP
jgi:hypothetical protein